MCDINVVQKFWNPICRILRLVSLGMYPSCSIGHNCTHRKFYLYLKDYSFLLKNMPLGYILRTKDILLYF